VNHELPLFNEKDQKAGIIRIKSQLEWVAHSPPPACALLDKRSMLRVVIKSATFLRDADMVGKQDPYITFKYKDKELRTSVKDGAGKQATWDETFQLPSIKHESVHQLVFKAFDKDMASSDLLGTTEPVDL
jgi:Ca2+-dependent lipid-binding protein